MEGVLLKKQQEEEEEEEEMQEESLERRQLPPQGHIITATGSFKDGGGTEDKGLLESLESIIHFDKDRGTVTNNQDWGSLKNEQIIDLEMLVEKPDSCDFYCPKCKSCITTIVLLKRQQQIKCPSCLSFIVPITSSCWDYCVRRPAGLFTSCFTTSEIDPRPRPGPGTSKKLDILKCILYGGLNESITSLSVVISAGSADAATLNILALGLANLIGGLFLFSHGLRELKNDTRSGETNEQGDRYEELLGQRGNFLLHSTVAVLSFLVFGLVPLVTFGFSFLKSDNRDLKLVAVVAAALVCITVLAIGKAYIQKASTLSSYLKTIVYYVSAGLAVSGVSYILGDMIKKALEKLGWFKSSVAVSLPITEIGIMKLALGSY